MRQETRTQIGTMTVLVNGETRKVEVPLEIIDTYHEDGRKDVTVKVPRLSTGAIAPEGE